MWLWTVSEAKALPSQANITKEITKGTQDLRIEIEEKYSACRNDEVQKIKKKLCKINDCQGGSMLAEGDKKKRKDMKDTSTKVCRVPDL